MLVTKYDQCDQNPQSFLLVDCRCTPHRSVVHDQIPLHSKYDSRLQEQGVFVQYYQVQLAIGLLLLMSQHGEWSVSTRIVGM